VRPRARRPLGRDRALRRGGPRGGRARPPRPRAQRGRAARARRRAARLRLAPARAGALGSSGDDLAGRPRPRARLGAPRRRPAPGAAGRGGPGAVARVVEHGPYRLALRITPHRAALPNAFEVALTRGGRPVRGAQVTARFDMLDMDMASQSYLLRETQPGVYA